MEERLQKWIANQGILSRRKAEEAIIQGKVTVNGKIVTELGKKVDGDKDIIAYQGKIVKRQNKKTYILLNKPIGYITTVEDQFKRNTVMELVKNCPYKVLPVGRLDMYTSGALILSNDGDFIYKVTHPKHEISKTYTVTVKGIVTKEDIEKLEKGVVIENYVTKPAVVKILKTDEDKKISRLELTIHEGKNRQVRKMCEAIGKKVLALHRSKIAGLEVKDLPLGTWRYLKQEEINKIISR